MSSTPKIVLLIGEGIQNFKPVKSGLGKKFSSIIKIMYAFVLNYIQKLRFSAFPTELLCDTKKHSNCS